MGSLYIHTHLGSEHINGARNVLYRAADNLKSNPIVDIEVKGPNDSCTTDFAEVTLGHFGAIEGECLCRDGSTHSRAYCALHAFSDECSLVKSSKATDVKVFNSFKICVKRNKEFKHSKNACSGNYVATKCFTSYCIPTGEFCGYNKLTPTENAGTPVMLEEESGRILSINHNHNHINHDTNTDTATEKTVTPLAPFAANILKLKYEAADTHMPVVGFEFITGDKPCWNNRLREEKQSKKSYPLLEIKETGCGEFNNFEDVVDVIKNKLKYKTFYQKINLEATLNNA